MADVDMTDAPTTSVAKKAATKGGDDAKAVEAKKRFEVKKVGLTSITSCIQSPWLLLTLSGFTVECRRPVGLGHRRRQLRHLPKPHHGPLHRVPS
jgi:hypothetical protein